MLRKATLARTGPPSPGFHAVRTPDPTEEEPRVGLEISAGKLYQLLRCNDVDDFTDSLIIFSPRPVPGNPGSGGVTTNQNVRDAELTGFEVEFAYDAPRWYAGVRTALSYSF